MAHAVESPLFGSLEMLIEEQVGRDRRLSRRRGHPARRRRDPCADPRTGLPITGSGGERWCVNCHAPGENLAAAVAAVGCARRATRAAGAAARSAAARVDGGHLLRGVSSDDGPGAARRRRTRATRRGPRRTPATRLHARPEDQRGVFGIGNSGYLLDPRALIAAGRDRGRWRASHGSPTPRARTVARASSAALPRRAPVRHRRAGVARRALQAAAQRVLRVGGVGADERARAARRRPARTAT